MQREIENNEVVLSGTIVSNFEFSHDAYGEGFYKAFLSVKRHSGTEDIIPIMVSERLADVKADWTGQNVWISGQFRSYNKHDGEKARLILSAFARMFKKIEEHEFESQCDKNIICLDGTICKPPIYRVTPLGREIADVLLAVNRPYGKSDYIPCICWGRNGSYAGSLEVGTRLHIDGRIQSREYKKKKSDNEIETRIAYEVSASKMEEIGEMEEE